jgi:Tol biopolymer transport system component
MKVLEKSVRLGLAALVVGVLAAVGLVVFLYAQPAEANYPGKPGKIAYTVSGGHDSEIYTIWPGGGGKRQLTHNSTGDFSPEYDPGGKRVAYTHEDPRSDEEIYTMKTDGSGKFNVTDNNFADNKTTGGDDFGPSYSTSGKKIAYVIYVRHDYNIYTTEIFTIKPDGSGKHRVTHSRAEEINSYWGSRP